MSACLRLVCGIFVILAALILPVQHSDADTTSSQTILKQAQQEAFRLYHSGKVLTAIQVLKQAIGKAKSSATPTDTFITMNLLMEICERADDLACVVEQLNAIPSELNNEHEVVLLNIYYRTLIIQSWGDEKDRNEHILEMRDFLSKVDAFRNPNMYIRLNLLAAKLYLWRARPTDAQAAIDRAFSLILALNDPLPFDMANWLSEIIMLTFATGDTERALNLYFVAGDFIAKNLPTTGIEYLNFRNTENWLLIFLGNSPQARKAAGLVVDLVTKLEIAENNREYALREAHQNLAISCFLTNDAECVKLAIDNHPLSKKWDSIVEAGKFSTQQEMEYGIVKVFSARFYDHVVPDSWVALFENDLDSQKDKALISARRAGLGLALLDQDKERAIGEILAGGKIRTELFEETINSAVDGFPLIGDVDRIFLSLAIIELSKLPVQDSRREIALQLFEVYNRSLRHADTEALSRIQATPSTNTRRLIHARARLASRQYLAERQSLKQILDKLQSDKKSAATEKSTSVYNYRLRGRLAEYGVRRRELSSEIKKESENLKPNSILPSVKEIQEVITDSEALISFAGIAGQVSFLCIRKDSFTLTMAPLEPHIFSDIKLLQLAFSNLNPPDPELDTQYPVEAAVRLYTFLIGPVSSCLKKGDHILWSPTSDLFGLPLGALLKSAPPKRNNGYDLSQADWLARDFSFSYVSSARGFLAARKLSKTRATEYAFLGIGDPKLSGQTLDGGSRNEVVLRRSAPNTKGKITILPELPDTSVELNEIASLFHHSSRILTQLNATERAFRREPLDRYAILSFATHGLIRNEIANLNEAALVLTPERENISSNDGLLTVSEIANLNLNASLVVLSACNTANFEVSVFGNEVYGLTTAFALAGVPTSLVTLWPVETNTSRMIVTRVFKELHEHPGQGVAHALSRSVNHFLDHPPSQSYLHPRFWAPFLIFGDGDIRPLETINQKKDGYRLRRFQITPYPGGGEVFKLTPDPATGQIFAVGIANIKDDRMQSFVSKLSQQGDVAWTTWDDKIGASRALIPVNDGVITAGYLSGPDYSVIPIVKKLGPTGDELWRKKIDIGNHDGLPIGATLLPDGNVLIAISASKRSKTPTNEGLVYLVVLSTNGALINKIEIEALPASIYAGGQLTLVGDRIVMSLTNRFSDIPKSEQRIYLDEYGDLKPCYSQTVSRLWLIDAQSLKVIASNDIKDFSLAQALLAPTGKLFGVGTTYRSCDIQGNQSIVEITSDAKVSTFYIEKTVLDTAAKAAIFIDRHRILLLATSKRIYDINLRPENVKWQDYANFDPADINYEKSEVTDGVLTEIDTNGKVLSQTWLQTGATIFLDDVVVSDGGVMLAGAVGSEVMWATFDAVLPRRSLQQH